MAEKKLNIKIRTDGAKRAKKDLGGVDNKISSLGKSALKAGGAFFAARGIVSGIKAVINLSGEQEMAEKKLEAALGKTSRALLSQASALQKLSMFGDEQIIEAQALIAAFVDEEDAIAQATQATLDLAAAKGMDLTASADLVSKTLGSSTNALSRYGIEVEGAVGSTERLDSLTENIADKFGGQAKAQTETMAGAMRQMEMAVGDAGEKMGSLLSPAVTNIATWLGNAAESAGEFFQEMSETSLETSIRELQSLGVNTLNLELAFAKAEAAKVKYLTVGLREEEEISANLENSANLRVGLMTQLAEEQAKLLEQGTSEEELRQQIAGAELAIYGASSGRMADQKVMAMQTKREAEAKLAEIALLKQLIDDQEVLIGKDQEDLEIIKKSEAAKEHILALEKAILENKKNQSEIPPPPEGGSPEIETLIMSEEQKASIRAEFNERFLEMTKEQHELQNMELNKAVERFREAGIEEVEIARFVAERKKAIDLDYKNNKISSVGSLMGAFGQLNQASKGSALVSKRLAQGEATMSTWVAVNKALAAGVPPWNIIQATAIGAMGLANVLKIESQSFAKGGDFITSGPQMIAVGDNPGGRERVQVTPLSSPNIDGPQGGITVNISAPLVDETVVESIIPAIEKAQRLNLA